MGNVTQFRQTATLNDYMDELFPSDREFEALFQSAVAISAYKPMRGGKSNFPAPVDFIESLFREPDEDGPIWEDVWERERSVKLLRASWLLKQYLREHRNNMWAVRTKINCPICDNETIETTLGFGVKLTWDIVKGHDVAIDQKSMRLLVLHIKCKCSGFSVDDFKLLEEIAKENAISQLRS